MTDGKRPKRGGKKTRMKGVLETVGYYFPFELEAFLCSPLNEQSNHLRAVGSL